MHKEIIASELKNSGFDVKVVYCGVEVTLKNRDVATIEVENALSQAFGDIEFNVMKMSYGVYVN